MMKILLEEVFGSSVMGRCFSRSEDLFHGRSTSFAIDTRSMFWYVRDTQSQHLVEPLGRVSIEKHASSTLQERAHGWQIVGNSCYISQRVTKTPATVESGVLCSSNYDPKLETFSPFRTLGFDSC